MASLVLDSAVSLCNPDETFVKAMDAMKDFVSQIY
jgi:hypothetical protein